MTYTHTHSERESSFQIIIPTPVVVSLLTFTFFCHLPSSTQERDQRGKYQRVCVILKEGKSTYNLYGPWKEIIMKEQGNACWWQKASSSSQSSSSSSPPQTGLLMENENFLGEFERVARKEKREKGGRGDERQYIKWFDATNKLMYMFVQLLYRYDTTHRSGYKGMRKKRPIFNPRWWGKRNAL